MIKLKDSISTQLLFNVIAIYLLVTFVITIIHMVIDLEYQKKYIKNELQTILQANHKSIINALWDINQNQLLAESEGLLKLPTVKALQIIDKNGTILISKKESDCENCFNSHYMKAHQLNKTIFNQNVYLGSIKLYSNQDVAIQRMKNNFYFIIISSLIKSTLLIIFFIIAFKKYLQQKLHNIVSQIDEINLEKNNQRIEYESQKDDELALLKNSVNQMLSKIDEQMLSLKNNKVILEQTVKERTQELKTANEQLKEDLIKIQKHEAEIIQQKNFLNAMVKNAPIPIFYKDREGKYKGVNDTWIKMVGFTSDEIMNKSVYDIAPKEIADVYAQQDEKVFTLEENPQIYKSVIYHKNTKKKYDVMFYKSAFFNEKNEVSGLIGSILDLTEINELQDERLRQEKLLFEQSKMASMGEMIGNIAHQWRQPLSIISTYATGLELHRNMNILNDELIKESCEKINENAQYLSTTIDDFKSFIKGDETVVAFHIQSVIESFGSLISPLIKQNRIHYVVNIKENIRIEGYPNQLIQCFMNFFNNANDAFSNEDKYIFIDEYVEDNNLIILFKDSAGGIPEEIISKVFEPYFTTKHQSQGTGLGLHMTYSLITKGMNGKITVENVSYKYEHKKLSGALFKIILPIS